MAIKMVKVAAGDHDLVLKLQLGLQLAAKGLKKYCHLKAKTRSWEFLVGYQNPQIGSIPLLHVVWALRCPGIPFPIVIVRVFSMSATRI